MKQSIKQIFNNMSMFFIFATVFASFGVMVSLDHESSYDKIDNLLNQKSIIESLTKLEKDDIELALIQFNGKSTQLHDETKKLHTLYQYSFIERFIVSNADEYLKDLKKLTELTTSFNNSANDYYNNKDKNRDKLEKEFYNINHHIDYIIINSTNYSKSKFNIHKSMTYIAFVLILLATFIFRRKLQNIYSDLHFLHNLDKKDYNIYSQEADAILIRMNRKPVTEENPHMIDPVTGINNHKGMVHAYSQKKGMKESNFTTVTVVEIDNFSKSKRAYSQEFTQTILKKVAFAISLHEKSTDVIARTDYNQFTIILSRSSKDQAYKDVELIRKSISEMEFKSNETGIVHVTISGGFVGKPNNSTLDESIRESKKVLVFTQKNGFNTISQVRDLAKDEL
ncbi:GGDEF domain-containing protein [Sulfurimonas sp.]|nr:GGDEF domain-containing protein [Sulfurimonas sp.]